MAVKRPKFDAPRGPGNAAGGKHAIPGPQTPLEPGTRATLWYKKRTVIVRVAKIGPESTFEGVVEAFDPPADAYRKLSVGDAVLFRRDKVQWVHQDPSP